MTTSKELQEKMRFKEMMDKQNSQERNELIVEALQSVLTADQWDAIEDAWRARGENTNLEDDAEGRFRDVVLAQLGYE